MTIKRIIVFAVIAALLVIIGVQRVQMADGAVKGSTSLCSFDVTIGADEYVEVCSGLISSITYSSFGQVSCPGGLDGTHVGIQSPIVYQQSCVPVSNSTVHSTLPDTSFTSQVAFVHNDGPNEVRFVGYVTGRQPTMRVAAKFVARAGLRKQETRASR